MMRKSIEDGCGFEVFWTWIFLEEKILVNDLRFSRYTRSFMMFLSELGFPGMGGW